MLATLKSGLAHGPPTGGRSVGGGGGELYCLPGGREEQPGAGLGVSVRIAAPPDMVARLDGYIV